MRLGGLFSGVGGFELAWTSLGHEVAWMCEWDKNARKVLEARFPGVPIYPDVRDLDPAEVEAVDVLTGGSPCQGFSVAGSRSGLEHSESQLFADYVRIMDGLAVRGLQYALWENVPGVLSIKNDDGERTFAHVIGALAGAGEPVRLDPKRKWNVGMAANARRAVAWRVLDSRYFGVAQRRRRVFACVAFGDSAEDRAGRTLLAQSEGVFGDFAAGVSAGQGAAGGVAGGVGGASEVAHTLTVASSKGATEDGTGRGTPVVADVAHTLTGNGFDASEDGTGRGTPIVVESGRGEWRESDAASSLRVGGSPSTLTIRKVRSSEWAEDETGSTLAARDYKDSGDLVLEPQAFNWQSGGDARGLDLTDVPSALSTSQTPAVLLTNREGKPGGGKGPLLSTEESLTLATGNGQVLFAPQAFDEMNFTTDPDTHHVLRAGTKQSTGAITDYGVRRLTPVECERLQSFPDGWTEPAGSDSARYKAMGNAVTVNVVRWILGRLP